MATTLWPRIAPCLKDAIHIAVDKEHQPTANLIEVLIRDCGQRGIAVRSSQESKNKQGVSR